MTNIELRIALAEELGWDNVREGRDGRVTGTLGNLLTFVPLVVPNWPENMADAMKLRESMRFMGIEREYDQRLEGGENAMELSRVALAVLCDTRDQRAYRLGFLLNRR